MAQVNNDKLCPLCWEDLTPRSPNSPQFPILRECCGATTCQSCLYRHLESVFEVTGDHRPLLCPFGCGAPVTDTQVRSCFQRQHGDVSLIQKCVGNFCYLYYLFFEGNDGSSFVKWIGAILCCLIGTILCCLSIRFIGARIVGRAFHTILYMAFWAFVCIAAFLIHGSSPWWCCWWKFLHTPEERRDLLRYEAWSKQMAYVAMAKKNDDVILHCPAPDCNFSWIVANVAHRQQKQAQEAHNIRTKLEKVPNNWVESDHNPRLLPRALTDSLSDGRCMVCGKCKHKFCGLCHFPWQHGIQRHNGYACVEYQRHFPAGINPEDALSFIEARPCPGCHQLTNRISGCNHVSCPCGTHWCYACGERWSGWRHYGCAMVFEPTTNDRGDNAPPRFVAL